MIEIPTETALYLSEAVWAFATVLLRVGALVSVLPAFGERSVPVRVKLVLALAFAAVVMPGIGPVATPRDVMELGRFAVTEAVVGLALGMGLRLFILALQTAGSIAAQSTSLSQILGGAAVDPLPAMGYILVLAGLSLAVMAGLHVRAAELLILSYDLFPAGVFPDGRNLSAWGLNQVSRAFALAFTLAAPFVVASLVYNLALGAINRAMPQLMVAFVGAPVITWGGLVLLMVSSPLILGVWLDALMSFAIDPMGAP